MPTLTDERFAALRALGYAGSTSDMLLAWLQAESRLAGPNLYVNPELAGGGLNTPPTNHTVGFGTVEYDMVPSLDYPGFFEFNGNTDQDAGRAYLAYDLFDNNPTLEVGVPYRYESEFFLVDGSSYSAAITVSGDNNVTILANQPVAVQGVWVPVWFEFTVDDPTFGLNIRAGTGTTAVSPFFTKVRRPTLSKAFPVQLGSKTVPDAWKRFLLARQLESPYIFEGDGTTPLTEANYHRNDWWYAYLGSLGYTGNMNDRELQFWAALGVAATSGPFSKAFNSAFDGGYV